MSRDRKLVYSTGNIPASSKDRNPSSSFETPAGPPSVVLRIERKGRKGKVVTIVETRGISMNNLQTLGKSLKTHLGCGGTIRDFSIEVQGDHRKKAADFFRNKGVDVRG